MWKKSIEKYLLSPSIFSHPPKQKPIMYSQGDRGDKASVSALPLSSYLIWAPSLFLLPVFHLELILPVLPKETKVPGIQEVYKLKRAISVRDQWIRLAQQVLNFGARSSLVLKHYAYQGWGSGVWPLITIERQRDTDRVRERKRQRETQRERQRQRRKEKVWMVMAYIPKLTDRQKLLWSDSSYTS